jgi:hypothetical protein
MTAPVAPAPTNPWPRRLGVAAGGAALLAALAWGLTRGTWRDRPGTAEDPPDVPAVDPRIVYRGPFRNVHPDVAYTGTASCGDCHPDQALPFAQHPMGRAMAPVAAMLDAQPYGADVRNPFEHFGRRFRVERRGQRMLHHQTALAGGEVVFEHTHDVDWVVGSGAHGYSYLTVNDGYVFQTPISWFTRKDGGIWDLSPGFNEAQCAGRVIVGACLFCHTNRVRPLPGEELRFAQPVFEGHGGIGCERCHGPGSVHVRERERLDPVSGGIDTSIVNPRHLEHRLRDSVCEQCHLTGLVKPMRRGRELFDFRPGLSFGQFQAVFVKAEGPGEVNKAVNHVEQMHQSKCYVHTEGKGKLGCISCHNPHEKPAPAARIDYFKKRCLNCHQQGCSLHLVERMRQSGQDSCIDCHMPRSRVADIVHAALTDHRILRKPGTDPPGVGPVTDLPIVAFYTGDMGPGADEAKRDLGIALARRMISGRLPPDLTIGRARPLLEFAVQRAPRDVEAQVLLAEVDLFQGRRAEAIRHFEAGLRYAPGSRHALARLAGLAAEDQRHDEAIAYARRLVATNPHVAEPRLDLASYLGQAGRWAGVEEQARAVLKIDPVRLPARQMLVMSLLRQGKTDEARRAFADVRRMQPGDLPQLEAWFARELRGGP